MELSELFLDRHLYRDNNQSSETMDASFVSADSSEPIPDSIPSGGAAQDINTGNVQIDGAQIEDGTLPSSTLDVSNWGWGQTSSFTSASLNTVTWGAGTFTSASGDTYSISAGTTGAMSAKTYIYLNLNVSTTTYRTTTISSTAVGVGKVLIAVAENGATDATYMLSEATQIVGDNILANTIDASKITTGQLVVGTNVGIGTAEDSAGVTTIIGNVVTTGYVNALNITAEYVVASISISSPTITGGTIAIGSGNAIFKADSNGIYLGNSSFFSAPFRVNTSGHVTATSLTLTNAAVGSGSAYTGNQIAEAYIGNLNASKITAGTIDASVVTVTNLNASNMSTGTISVGGSGQPGTIVLNRSGNNGYLTWSGGNKIWSDNSEYMGFDAGGGRFYFYDDSDLMALFQNGSQATFYDGINCNGNFNVDRSYSARFEGIAVYFSATGYNKQYIHATNDDMRYYSDVNHEFYQDTTIKAIIDENIWTAGDLEASGSKPFIIPHPDGTPDKLLRYTAQESPEVILRHRGKGNTGEAGSVEIILPKHFELVTDKKGSVTANLTPVGNNFIFLEKEPTNSSIEVKSNNKNVSFHYEVIAIRKGYLNSDVELKNNLLSKKYKTISKIK